MPTMSAPASFAAFALSPWANTAIRIFLPVPAGSTTDPRTVWSDFFASMPRLIIKQAAVAKFDEAVDVAINLGIDAKKSDQTVRGSGVLPGGTGKKVRIAVCAPGDSAKQ